MWNPTKEEIVQKFKSHKAHAEQRGIDCNLTIEDFTSMININGGICDYTEDNMYWFKERHHGDNVSLERLDPDLPYSTHNLLLVRTRVNQLKSKVLETKGNSGVGTLDIITKEMLNKICEVVYNPVKLKEVQSKYLTKKDNIEVPESITEIKTTNPEVSIAHSYAGLGKLVESVATFELTYAQYKSKINSKKCGLTGTKFKENDVKFLYWYDKTKPYTKDNCIVTTMKLCTALDKFTTEASLSLTELKSLCKVIALK